MWQELIDILGTISGYYKKLLGLSQQKRTVLVMVDLKMLEALLKQEEELIARIHEMENKRRQVFMMLAKKIPEVRFDSKLTEIYAYIPAEHRASLQKLHAELNTVIGRVNEAENNNNVLVSGALSAVNYHLNQLGHSAVEPAYGGNGQEVISHQKKFDFHA